MPFSLEEISDFDQKFFNDGSGWAIACEIHMGIFVRAKTTGHTSVAATFATQVDGLIWLQESPGGTRNSLRAMLEKNYLGIQNLLSSNSSIRWTESSGRSPEWTLATLTADIGMGDFDDLLVKPQRPEPLVWLVQALKRLRYPKLLSAIQMQKLIVIPATGGFGLPYVYRPAETDEVESGRSSLSYQDAWENMSYRPADEFTYEKGYTGVGLAPLDQVLNWRAPFYFTFGTTTSWYKFKYLALRSRKTDGTYLSTQTNRLKVKCLDYVVSIFASGYSGPDWVVKIGSSAETNIGHLQVSIPPVQSVSDDLDFEGTKTITAELITTTPTYPFTPTGFLRMAMKNAWVYCDLPEVMGLGRITGIVPKISGAAEIDE